MCCSHIYQPVVDSLIHVAKHLQVNEKRYELLCLSLKLFVQQGIEAKRASERADASSTHKVKSLSLLFPLSALTLPVPFPLSPLTLPYPSLSSLLIHIQYMYTLTLSPILQATSSSFSLGLLLPVIATVNLTTMYNLCVYSICMCTLYTLHLLMTSSTFPHHAAD